MGEEPDLRPTRKVPIRPQRGQEVGYSFWELLLVVLLMRPINSQLVANRPRGHRLALIPDDKRSSPRSRLEIQTEPDQSAKSFCFKRVIHSH